MVRPFFPAFRCSLAGRGLLAVACLLLLNRQPAFAQAFNQVPDEVEYQALADLYASTQGPGWIHNTNWLEGHTHIDFANWYGVRVVNGDVFSLRLIQNNLEASLPASLDKLARLTSLDMAYNKISGPLPEGLANLELSFLNLPNNQLTGTLPEWLGSMEKLTGLGLSTNRFPALFLPAWGICPRCSSCFFIATSSPGPFRSTWVRHPEFGASTFATTA